MRLQIAFLAVLAGSVLSTNIACKQAKKAPPGAVNQEASGQPQLATAVRAGDPAVEGQLLNGFYGVEDGAWRWTGKDFSVALRAPDGAKQGAVLKLVFSFPPPSAAKLKTVTLSASVNGTALAPETYSQAGQFEYKRDLSPAMIVASPVKVDFHLDKAVPPGGGDLRELGVVALTVGLEAK